MPLLRLDAAYSGASQVRASVNSCVQSVRVIVPHGSRRAPQQQVVAQHGVWRQQGLQHAGQVQQYRWRHRASDTTASGSSGAPEGQVSAAVIEAMQGKIKEELQADSVVVSDVYGDGRHVSIDVVSNVFEGKTSVQRQRLVYKAIWVELQETVHAVDAMTTKTPQEAS